MKITVGHASLPRVGFTANGDAVFVQNDGSRLLLVVIDALGHGPAAASVAATALGVLGEIPHSSSLHDVVERVHAHLRDGRGAAALFLLVSAATASPAAVSPGIFGALASAGGAGGAHGGATAGQTPVEVASYEVCSVGNVEARARPSKLPLLLTPGVLGLRLRAPRIVRGTFTVTTRVVIFTDGISGRIDVPSVDGIAPEAASSSLLQHHRREHDDATVAIADIEL